MTIKIFSNDIKAQFDTQLRHTIKVDYPHNTDIGNNIVNYM